MVTGRMGQISVFCSYAREDQASRELLERCLEPLRNEKVIDEWYDNQIKPGSRWDDQIKGALEKSRLVLFLVSPDLLASEYVGTVELPRALELERAGRCHVVPVIVRPTEWGGSPLAQFQALPGEARPIDSFSDAEDGFRQVAEGLRDVCKRIVDWENPYKRAQVGDWTCVEQTMTVATGQSLTARATCEVVEKDDTRAVILLQATMEGQQQENRMTIDLTEPLEDKMGDALQQLGQGLPSNAEVWIGPSQYEEDVIFVGGKRYETVKATRRMRFAQQADEVEGTVQNWRCIDVPLDGIVKGTSDLQRMRQNMVLLDYGHGDARARKPEVLEASGARSGGASTTAPPQAIFSPGRWHMEMQVFGVVTQFDLMLHPDGALQGRQTMMGIQAEVQGQWGFDLNTSVLTLDLVAVMMGMPTGQDRIQMQVAPGEGGVLQGADAMGRRFLLRRVG